MFPVFLIRHLYIALALLAASYFLARAIYAQLCVTSSIAIKGADDLNIYNQSVNRLPVRIILVCSLPMAISGAVALSDGSDPELIKLVVFIAFIVIYVMAAYIIAYRLFRVTVTKLIELGALQERKPDRSAVRG